MEWSELRLHLKKRALQISNINFVNDKNLERVISMISSVNSISGISGVLNTEGTSDASLDSWLDLGSQMVDQINNNHQFLQQVMSSNRTPSVDELLTTQKKVEEFNLDTLFVSKTVSLTSRAVDSLTKIQ